MVPEDAGPYRQEKLALGYFAIFPWEWDGPQTRTVQAAGFLL